MFEQLICLLSYEEDCNTHSLPKLDLLYKEIFFQSQSSKNIILQLFLNVDTNFLLLFQHIILIFRNVHHLNIIMLLTLSWSRCCVKKRLSRLSKYVKSANIHEIFQTTYWSLLFNSLLLHFYSTHSLLILFAYFIIFPLNLSFSKKLLHSI